MMPYPKFNLIKYPVVKQVYFLKKTLILMYFSSIFSISTSVVARTTDAQWSLFSLKSRTFGLGQKNSVDKFWGIWGVFGRTMSINFGKVHIFWETHKILQKLHQLFDWQYIGQIVITLMYKGERDGSHCIFINSDNNLVWLQISWKYFNIQLKMYCTITHFLLQTALEY